jgi:high-affinity nickel permease
MEVGIGCVCIHRRVIKGNIDMLGIGTFFWSLGFSTVVFYVSLYAFLFLLVWKYKGPQITPQITLSEVKHAKTTRPMMHVT